MIQHKSKTTNEMFKTEGVQYELDGLHFAGRRRSAILMHGFKQKIMCKELVTGVSGE